jgi:GntR family transcriptional regulator
MVPSVRELARELAINPNTIARAYRQLQDDRVLEPVRGTGLEIATGAAARCRQERLNLIRVRLHQVLIEARQSGLEAADIRKLVDTELSLVSKEGA